MKPIKPIKPPASRFIPFGRKLIATYAAILMLAIVSLGTYSYQSALRTLERNTQSNIAGTLEQIKDNIAYKLDEYQKVANLIYQDPVLQRMLQGQYDAEQNYTFYSKYLNPKMESAIKVTEDFIWITLYTDNPAIDEVYYVEERKQLPIWQGFEVRRMAGGSQAWYRQLDDKNVRKQWLEVEQDGPNRALSLVTPLYDFDNLRFLGWLRVNVKKDMLFQAVNRTKVGDRASLLLSNQRDRKVLYASSSGSDTEWQADHYPADRYLTVEQAIPGTNWLLGAYIPKGEMQRNAARIREATLLVCGLSFVVILLISGAIAKVMTKRIRKISQSIDAVKEGNFHKRIYFRSNDEFGLIAGSFNDMAGTIEKLVNEVYVSNLKKKEAELEMLQNQINPHFLYNTLSSISRLAKMGELEKMHEMVLGLAKFYRLVMNTGNLIIPLKDELEQVKAYLDIQRIKYDGAVTAGLDAADDVVCLPVLKLIMQPFVENVFMHAWYRETIHIRIVCRRQEGRLLLEITDNGCGMEAAVVERLNQSPETMGYGMRNVAERIRLQFGAEYGVRAESEPGAGTTIRIVMPIEDLCEKG